MAADLVAEETGRCCPRQHLLGLTRGGVAGNGEVVAMDYREGVVGQKGVEPSICMKHLSEKQHKLYDIQMCYLSTGVYLYRCKLLICAKVRLCVWVCVTCVQVCVT